MISSANQNRIGSPCQGTLLLLLGLLLSACERNEQQVLAETSTRDSHLSSTVELKLEPYVGRLRQIQVQLGSESYPFLFDTGGGLTLIDPEFTHFLNCEPYGQLTGYRMSGEQVKFQQCGHAHLQMGALGIEQDVAVFDLMALLPEEFPPLRGVISLHTFQDYVITLDLLGNRLILETEQSLRERVKDMQTLRMFIERDVEGRGFSVYLEAKAQKGSLRLLLDSGNLAGFMLAPHAIDQLGLDPPGQDTPFEVNLDIVGLGSVTTPIIISDISHDGVISAEFMEKLVLTMDFRSNRIWGKFDEHPVVAD